MTLDSARKQTLLPYLFLTIAFLPFVYQAGLFWHYTNDDAYITFRFSRFLAEGRGPFFNIGEHVEGYTNLLQMLLAALAIKCLGPDSAPVFMKVLGILYGAGCVLVAFLLCRALLTERNREVPAHVVWLAALAASIVSASPAFAVNCNSGLETSLFSFLLCLGMFLGLLENQSRRSRGSWIPFALAVLTRPEGAMLFGVYWLARAAVFLRGHVRDGGSARGLLMAPYARLLFANGVAVTFVCFSQFVFRYVVYDGELLPNTYYAKQGGFSSISTSLYFARGFLPPLLGVGGIAVALVGLLAGAKRISENFLPILAVAVAGGLLPFVTGADWMVGYRLLVPYLPAAAVAVAYGWALLLARPGQVSPAVSAIAAMGCLALLWTVQDGPRKGMVEETSVRAQGYVTGHGQVARWIRAHAKPGNTVAVMDIGIIGYRCIDQNILDLTGLTDRYIAKSKGSFLDKDYDPAYVLDRKPNYIVLMMYAPGEPYTVPKPDTVFYMWTDIEGRLQKQPGFQQHYVWNRPADPARDKDWLARFATMIGAQCVFEHAHPGIHSVLAVFQRGN